MELVNNMTVDQCLDEAVANEAQALEMASIGDFHAARAHMGIAAGYWMDALEREASGD